MKINTIYLKEFIDKISSIHVHLSRHSWSIYIYRGIFVRITNSLWHVKRSKSVENLLPLINDNVIKTYTYEKENNFNCDTERLYGRYLQYGEKNRCVFSFDLLEQLKKILTRLFSQFMFHIIRNNFPSFHICCEMFSLTFIRKKNN